MAQRENKGAFVIVILASNSPRRKELLEIILKDFFVISADIDESVYADLEPKEMVKKLAQKKAKKVLNENPNTTVIGADTAVVLGKAALGKPKDFDEAAAMLKMLSGKEHFVYTGVCVVNGCKEFVLAEKTAVRFCEMSDKEIEDYVLSGDPMDKAGAYGIQGSASRFIESISGDFYNVMGLPVHRLYSLMKKEFCEDLR